MVHLEDIGADGSGCAREPFGTLLHGQTSAPHYQILIKS
jgi:hypothetical protein